MWCITLRFRRRDFTNVIFTSENVSCGICQIKILTRFPSKYEWRKSCVYWWEFRFNRLIECMNRARSSRWHHSSVYFSLVSHSERTSEDNPQLLFQLVQLQKNRKKHSNEHGRLRCAIGGITGATQNSGQIGELSVRQKKREEWVIDHSDIMCTVS